MKERRKERKKERNDKCMMDQCSDFSWPIGGTYFRFEKKILRGGP
jgi:hypothetical protein